MAQSLAIDARKLSKPVQSYYRNLANPNLRSSTFSKPFVIQYQLYRAGKVSICESKLRSQTQKGCQFLYLRRGSINVWLYFSLTVDHGGQPHRGGVNLGSSRSRNVR